MITFKQFLLREKTDTVLDDNGNEVVVYINPQLEDLKKLTTSFGKMRYFFHGGNIYTWDASSMIHGAMADALQLEFEPNWFDDAGYWGQGQDAWIDAEQDIMPTIYRAANPPKLYGDFWQVGAWQSTPRSLKYEIPFRTRASHNGPRGIMRGGKFHTLGGPVSVQAHSRGGYPVHAYTRSLPD